MTPASPVSTPLQEYVNNTSVEQREILAQRHQLRIMLGRAVVGEHPGGQKSAMAPILVIRACRTARRFATVHAADR
jgi:hypothetical protein